MCISFSESSLLFSLLYKCSSFVICRLLSSRVGSTCLLLLDAIKALPPAAQRAAREQAQVCNDFLNALMLNHTISVDVADAGAAKFAELFK